MKISKEEVEKFAQGTEDMYERLMNGKRVKKGSAPYTKYKVITKEVHGVTVDVKVYESKSDIIREQEEEVKRLFFLANS